MPDDTDETTETLEPIAYLSRSENRLQVLEALTETITKPALDTPGYEPRELREVTSASEATVSRILNEFDERGWAERDVEGKYTATPVGQSIAIGFEPLLDSMEAIQHLGDAVALLPLNELTIGLQHFSDAMVREPQGPGVRDWDLFYTELSAESTTHLLFSYVPPSGEGLDEMTEQITADSQDYCGIWSESAIEFQAQTAPGQVRAQLDAGARIFSYDGHMPCNIFIFDETVVFENSQIEGVRDGTAIVSEDAVVREWALKVHDRYREISTELTAEDLPE